VLGEDRPDVPRDLLVDLEARHHENQFRALPLGRYRRHRRPDAERARFIACRSYDTAFLRPADGDGLSAQVRIVALLHRSIKRIHIDVDDLPLWR